ncbi:MAG: hypothetical protein AB1Z98_21890 [Nannocystaceae bacterium]
MTLSRSLIISILASSAGLTAGCEPAPVPDGEWAEPLDHFDEPRSGDDNLVMIFEGHQGTCTPAFDLDQWLDDYCDFYVEVDRPFYSSRMGQWFTATATYALLDPGVGEVFGGMDRVTDEEVYVGGVTTTWNWYHDVMFGSDGSSCESLLRGYPSSTLQWTAAEGAQMRVYRGGLCATTTPDLPGPGPGPG